MDEPIRHRLEACRSGSDDLREPDMLEAARALEHDAELRRVFERSQQWDAAISAALDDVGLPAGLEERIMARLAASAAVAAEPTATAEEPLAKPRLSPGGSPLAPAARFARRYWTGAAALAVAAGLCAVAVNLWLARSSDLPIETLADQWQAQLGEAWRDGDTGPPEFPVPRAILVRPARWQQVGTFAAMPVVAYELVQAHVGKAMLYVSRATRDDVPGAPPASPMAITGGKAIASWQSGGHLYVLVVDDERQYPLFVQPASSPLA